MLRQCLKYKFDQLAVSQEIIVRETSVTHVSSPLLWNTSDPNQTPPLSSNNLHLQSLIKPAKSSHPIQYSSIWSTIHYPELNQTPYLLYLPVVSLPPVFSSVSANPTLFSSRSSPGFLQKTNPRLSRAKNLRIFYILSYHLPSVLCSLTCLWQKTGPWTNISMDPCPPSSAEVLEELVKTLLASLTPVTTPPSNSVSAMALLASYAGDAAGCGGFLLQVALFIEMQPQRFTMEHSKVAFLISLLNGKALIWPRAIWNAYINIINSYTAFTNHFKEVFGSDTGELSAPDQLLRLRQGSSTTSDYTHSNFVH